MLEPGPPVTLLRYWQRVRTQRVRHAGSQMAMDGVWSCDGDGGMAKRINQDKVC